MKRLLITLKEKWPEYLLEILVLIIGIYGAFALDEWKENRNNSKRVKEILIQIKTDLRDNLEDINNDLSRYEIATASVMRLENTIYNNLPYEDLLCIDFQYLIFDDYTIGHRTGFDNLKEFGMNLFSNDSLKSAIRDLYERILPRLSPSEAYYDNLGNFLGPYYNTHFTPNLDISIKLEFNKKYNIGNAALVGSDTTRTGFVPLNFDALKKDSEFKMLMKRSKLIRSHKLRWYTRAKETSEKLIQTLDNELEKL